MHAQESLDLRKSQHQPENRDGLSLNIELLEPRPFLHPIPQDTTISHPGMTLEGSSIKILNQILQILSGQAISSQIHYILNIHVPYASSPLIPDPSMTPNSEDPSMEKSSWGPDHQQNPLVGKSIPHSELLITFLSDSLGIKIFESQYSHSISPFNVI